ncbi:hypothetical protein HS088_TW02G00594 [Tripterygium wilfordii]|uniref:SOSEKI DIX-like domain-containing protein n=1 Tax=Tripterygium wilfordii TaxID=458696 RepID=A0A7J7DZ73_TRIWF|nr:hypothetical protein HS088_TW02G00594 [Tripterygium wilfordii]
MEARMNKYRQVSPERAKVWTERSPKYRQQNQKVAVVYYLCKNRQLEHPHFIEVPLSSPDGLYLRDVIEKLNVLRGRGMASMYSWSSKRSYKNGFVWHDLSEDDLILPAHGNEYVLKGSELFEESNPDNFSTGNIKIKNLKQSPEPISSMSQDDSSSSSSLNGKETKHSQDDELSPPAQRPGSSGVSPESSVGKNSSCNVSLSLTEYKIYKSEGSADASTQTEENVGGPKTQKTCTRGVSTEDGSLESECNDNYRNRVPHGKDNSEITGDSVSPPPSSSSASSSGGKTETLESLIRADASKINSFRILEEEDIRMPTNAKLKATNVLMQLISCGSISVKDHSFGIVPTYRAKFSHSKFSSPLFPTLMFGELDCLSENPRLMGLRLEDKEYFSGSLVETKMLKEEGGGASLQRSSSYNADRACKQLAPVDGTEDSTSESSKCIPLSIKASITKQPRSESMRSSPISEKPRNSSEEIDGSQAISSRTCNGGSKRMIEAGKSKRPDPSRIEKEKVIKIEESLLQELGL